MPIINSVTHQQFTTTAPDQSLYQVLSRSAFDTGLTGFNGRIRAIAAQPNGKILVGGDFTSYNGTPISFFSVEAENTKPSGVFFKPDGTKMYVLGNTGNGDGQIGVHEYDLSVAWVVNSASFLQRFLISVFQESNPTGLFFKPDGTKMYVVGTGGDTVDEYNLASAWNVSTASFFQEFSIAAQETSPSGVFFKDDGTKMYVIGTSGIDVNEYDLSSAWDISTASFINPTTEYFSVAAQESFPNGLFFKPDGTKVYVIGSLGDDVNEYDLSVAWDIATASFLQVFSVAAEEVSPQGLFFKPDGTKMYVLGASGVDVNEYNLSSAWNVSSAVFLQTFSVAAQETLPQGLFFKSDGTKMYVVGATGDDVNEYDLSSAWNVSSAVFLQTFSVAAQEISPTDVFFKPDGTRMYILGAVGDDVNEYILSSAWDVSSASFVQTFSVAAQETTPNGLFFKPDGTKMYVIGSGDDAIWSYDVNAWDISTAVYNGTPINSFSVAAQDSAPIEVFFKPDGTKMYVLGASGVDVNEYNLSSAWNVSSAVFLQTFSVALQETRPQGLFFKPDGTKMYVVGNTESVYEYDLSSAWDVSTASFIYPTTRIMRLNADGTRDTEFDLGTGIFDNSIYAIAIQPDGKILVGGLFTQFNGVRRNRLVRLNADGTEDTAFNNNLGSGFIYSEIYNPGYVEAIYIQPDGKILVGGYFQEVNGVFNSPSHLARLNADGTRDNTFGPNLTSLNSTVNTIAIQSNGLIVIGGFFTLVHSGSSVDARRGIAWLDSSGQQQSAPYFALVGGLSNTYIISAQPDGKILVGGDFTKRLLRLNADGTRDTAFNNNLGLTAFDNGIVNDIAIQADGKILVSGTFTSFNGKTRKYIVKLNADGTEDIGFNSGTSFNVTTGVDAIALQPNGRVLLGGDFTSYNGITQNRITRLFPSGQVDNTLPVATYTTSVPQFINKGTGFNDEVYAITLQPDGQILVAGEFTSYNGVAQNYTARLNTDGSLDTDFFGTGFNSSAGMRAIALQPDGKILAGGEFTSYNGSPVNFFSVAGQETGPSGLFFKPDGTVLYVVGTGGDRVYAYALSTAWNVSSAVFSQSFSVAAQETGPTGLFFKPDGTKMYVVGATGDDVNEYNLSVAWNIATASFLQVFSVSLQDTSPSGLFFKPDGTKMYVVGNVNDAVNEYNLSVAWNIATASFLGSISIAAQETFSSGLFFKPDGTKMYVIGTTGDDVNEYDLSSAWNVTGASASFVQTFSVAAQETTPTDVFFKPDGTVMYVVGATADTVFQYNLGTAWNVSTASYINPTNRIIRLNADGTRDTGFSIGTGFNNTVRAIAVQPDGKILVGGEFTSYNNIFQNRIARLNANGSRDTNFGVVSGNGFNITPLVIVLQPDGKILVGGDFTTYDGVGQARIIRLNANGSRDTSFVTGTSVFTPGGFSGVCSNSTRLATLVGEINIGNRIVTTDPSTASVTQITNSLGGPGSLTGSTTPTVGNNDDGYWTLTLPFSIAYLGTSYNTIYVGTNSYVTFGSGATDFQSLSATIPNLPKIMWAAQDNSVQRIYYGTEGVAPNRTYRVRIEGNAATSGSLGAPGMLSEYIFYEASPNQIDLQLAQNNRGTTSTAGLNNRVSAIALQPDGKILAGGDFTTYDSVIQNFIIRLNADGSRDTSFVTGTPFGNQANINFSARVYALALQPDGKILVGGDFQLYNGVTQRSITRLNADGTRDTGFNSGTGFNELQLLNDQVKVNAITLQPDGKILMGGEFTSYNGNISRNRIIMLNTDGSVPTTIDNHYITEDSPLNIVMTTFNVRDGSTLRWNIVGDSRDSLDPNTGTVTVSGNETVISTTTISTPVPGSVSMTIAKATGTVVAETDIITVRPPNVVLTGLSIFLDAGNAASYPGTGTTWTDLSGNGNNGTLINSPTYTSAGDGSYFSFGSGANQRTSFTYTQPVQSAATAFTWNIWTYPVANQDGYVLMGYRGTTPLQFYKLTTQKFEMYPAEIFELFALNVWQNICVIYDGTQAGTANMKMYVNGVQTGLRDAVQPDFSPSPMPFFVGGDPDAGEFATARISQVLVYNRALTHSEVITNFNAIRDRYGL